MSNDHITNEMADLIQKVESAIYKDRKAYDQWQKDLARTKQENRALKQMIEDGNTYVRLIPEPLEPEKFFTMQVRRGIRYRLFRIRDGGAIAEEHDKGLKAWIELQFKPGMVWEGFTFTWDVSPSEPLKVITPFEWQSSGGKIDPETNLCVPSGFTNQAM